MHESASYENFLPLRNMQVRKTEAFLEFLYCKKIIHNSLTHGPTMQFGKTNSVFQFSPVNVS